MDFALVSNLVIAAMIIYRGFGIVVSFVDWSIAMQSDTICVKTVILIGRNFMIHIMNSYRSLKTSKNF